MGRVFTPEQIENNQIPEPGAHERAGRLILHALQDDYWRSQSPVFVDSEDPLIETLEAGRGIIYAMDVSPTAALVYGSTALGNSSVRSDVDVLFTYHHADKTLPYASRIFTVIERELHVPVESKELDLNSFLTARVAGIDALYLDHLLEVQGMENPRWSFGWPAEKVYDVGEVSDDVERQLHIDMIRYCRSKVSLFARGMVGYRGVIDYRLFQRALELPTAIGRKAIGAAFGPDAVRADMLRSPEAMQEKTNEILANTNNYAEPGPRELMLSIQKINKNYNHVLSQVITGEYTLDMYRDWVVANYLPSIMLARQASRAWGEMFERGYVMRKDEENAAIACKDVEGQAEYAEVLRDEFILDYEEGSDELPYYRHVESPVSYTQYDDEIADYDGVIDFEDPDTMPDPDGSPEPMYYTILDHEPIPGPDVNSAYWDEDLNGYIVPKPGREFNAIAGEQLHFFEKHFAGGKGHLYFREIANTQFLVVFLGESSSN